MYSKDVIFMDGEFVELSATGTKFVSIALIKPDDSEYYAINADYSGVGCSEWVKENVLNPLYVQEVHGDSRNTFTALNFNQVYGKPEKRIIREIKEFIGDKEKPYLVADVCQFDWMGICKLFGIYDIPFHYIPIDFASILWSKGIDPDVDRIELAKEKEIDISKFKKHNALDDARVLKSLYELISEPWPSQGSKPFSMMQKY